MRWGVSKSSTKSSKKEKYKARVDAMEKKRSDKISKSKKRSKLETKIERAHKKNLNNRKYEVDYKFYRALGQSHSTARRNASLDMTDSRVETGENIVKLYRMLK